MRPLLLLCLCCGCADAVRVSPSISLGMNLSSVSRYSTEIVFVDVYKQSSSWFSQSKGREWGHGIPLDLSPEGHVRSLKPDQQAEKLLFPDHEGHYPAGVYTCFYDGTGEIVFGGSASVEESVRGRVRVRVDPTKGGISLKIVKTDVSDPVRNIRLVLPNHHLRYEDVPFHSDFVKRLTGFGVVRFMDWQQTNDSKQVEWSDRPKLEHDNQGTEKGVALEWLIRLCNDLKIDPWFCIPHQASDGYVREFARLVKKQLGVDRRIYIEYSNEVWNTMFQQSAYCRTKGIELKLSTDDYEATMRYYSRRAVEIFAIFEEEFGGRDRLVRVLGAQGSNPWTGTSIMDWKEAHRHADAIAIAPYFGGELGDPKTASKVANMTVEELLVACAKASRDNAKWIQTYAKEAQKRGLKLFAYEGGQGLAGSGDALENEKMTKLFHAANRAPGMEQIYIDDLKQWRECGGELHCVFASVGGYSKWGSWGLLEYGDQDPKSAPKWRGVQAFLRLQR